MKKMRIKKKHIREGLDSEKEAKIRQMQSDVTDTIDGIDASFVASGIPDVAAKNLATDIVSSVFNESNSYESSNYEEIADRVRKANVSGNNIALVKANENKMYYHILDVIIDDNGVQLKGGISRSKDEITNPLLGSYNITPKNESTMGPYALNIFNKVLDAAERNKVLDVSDMKNPEIIYDDAIEEAGGSTFESVRPKMSKDDLIESVKSIGRDAEHPRKVIKTFKVKNLKNGKK
tara:strand:- start:487 stop:1191 length:705 start_codon:yes stop_codon:yes gene_type:complete